jgi:RNA recognition motif-containing protein
MAALNRTIYVGNLPPDTTAEEVLNLVHSGVVESFKLFSDKNFAFISFLSEISAIHFFATAKLYHLSLNNVRLKINWGKQSPIPLQVSLAVTMDKATRNVYFGNIPKSKGINIPELRQTLESRFGPIENIRIVKRNIASSTNPTTNNDTLNHSSSDDLVTDIVSSNYENSVVFIHFYNINSAIRTVQELSMDPDNPYKIFYGKDRCAKISRYQREFVANYLCSPDPDAIDDSVIISMLSQRAFAALEINTSTAHFSAHPPAVDNIGNRTIYIGGLPPSITIEDVCDTIKGYGGLERVKFIPEKGIAFLTFIEPIVAAEYYMFNFTSHRGVFVQNFLADIGWGKQSGPMSEELYRLVVERGAARNIYLRYSSDALTPEEQQQIAAPTLVDIREVFSRFGSFEKILHFKSKYCFFINFTTLQSAVEAMETIRTEGLFKGFKISYGKDGIINKQHFQLPQQLSKNDSTNGINGYFYTPSYSYGGGEDGLSTTMTSPIPDDEKISYM